eukprot:7521483-Pyramimonas_sp.AAC.1
MFTWCSRLSAAHILSQPLQEFHGFPSPAYQGGCFEKIQDYVGATVRLIRCVEVPRMAFWYESGSSRRNSQVDPWRWNPESNDLAGFRGPMKRKFGGSIASNIVDASWVYTGPRPRPRPCP